MFGGQFVGNKSFLQKKLTALKEGAVIWNGNLLLEEMTYKINKINRKMITDILDGNYD